MNMNSRERFVLRVAEKKDCKELCRLVKALALSNKEFDADGLLPEDLERDGFDTHHPKYKCYVIDDKELPGVLCGYILFYPSYDAWKGPAIRIENIYVSPEYQRNNLGSLLYTQVAKEAYENGCCKVDVNVFAWNSATEFYSKLGAIDITEKEHYHLFRLDKKGIETLALKL